MTAPDLSVIIVSWNVCARLERCLAALPAAITPACSSETIVIDNASDDGSQAMLEQRGPQIRLIANPHNRLYTAAANQGLAAACGRHLLLLNPDTLPHPGSLARLIAYADAHPSAGLLGPRILDAHGRDDLRTGRLYPTPLSEALDWVGLTRRFPHHRLMAANLRPDFERGQIASVPLLSGACLLLNQSLPPDLRRLDPSFPMYGEDVDLSRRIQAAGYETVLVGDALIEHTGGESSRLAAQRSALMAVAGVQRYFRRWSGAGAAYRHRLGMAVVAIVKWGAFSLLGLLGRESQPASQRRLHADLLRWALREQGEIAAGRLAGAGFEPADAPAALF
jgi:GT2 family glycosyltransferase